MRAEVPHHRQSPYLKIYFYITRVETILFSRDRFVILPSEQSEMAGGDVVVVYVARENVCVSPPARARDFIVARFSARARFIRLTWLLRATFFYGYTLRVGRLQCLCIDGSIFAFRIYRSATYLNFYAVLNAIWPKDVTNHEICMNKSVNSFVLYTARQFATRLYV